MPRTELTPQDKEYKKVISATLNELLQLSGKKQIDITRQTGIPASTLTGYFKGTRLPSPVNVQKLADFFNVLKSDVDPRFKKISESDTDGLRIRLLFKYEKLNTENKKKVVDYADNKLKDQKRQQNKIHPINENDNTYYVDVLGSVSAGTGEWLTDEQHEEVMVNNEPPAHDFALRVNGDSMTPTFSDGQIIYVNKIYDTDEVRNNQFVIAELNGDSYVKKIVFDDDRKNCRLISLNKRYADIEIKKSDDFKIVGVVII
ncbi:LexA family transcriptional regulator [Ligilactobacillus salivarius]|uniref:LexA family transcriptional regulator n=1 Tax=Ligilactobacillus salivarius TaxID=1624 RepID=UPI00136A1727|nr:LexA family transcriptional regulator [Ligilactobacillus salivarius]MYZ03924.1 helix-turn-helix domain-containing protein [Ligilactobacillus salivarius]MYZ71780.1 helix-turn-helix domain-containing protein [Ligilactobacillus salivarius]MYZ77311.1 helix-turn-helix domain-containing protein [Ligilactobacillus salivarius]